MADESDCIQHTVSLLETRMRMNRRHALGALAALPLMSRPVWAQSTFPTLSLIHI